MSRVILIVYLIVQLIKCSGYMSPEYAMKGLFSEKSDIFSFGVLLLEIISGRKNTSFHNHEQALTLLEYVSLSKLLFLPNIDSYSKALFFFCYNNNILFQICIHIDDAVYSSSFLVFLRHGKYGLKRTLYL